MDPRGSRRAGVPDAPDAADLSDVVDGTGIGPEAEADRSEPDDDGSDVPWAGIGAVVLVLVAGAFVTGWHFGRRWGRLMGW